MSTLRFDPEAKPRGQSGARYEAYFGAETVGEFHRRHPGPERLARSDLANDLRRRRCETRPPLGPRSFAEVELARAGRRREWHDHGRVFVADRGAITRRIGGASALLAATGFKMTKAGTLSLGGAWGHEATISMFVYDYSARLRAAGAAGTADTWWTWSEDRGGLQQFRGEIHRHVTHGSPMSLTGWQSLMRWAERRAGRSARQSGSAAAEEPTLSGKAPRAADRGGKQGAEEAAPALALPA